MGRNLTERACSLSRERVNSLSVRAFNTHMGAFHILYDSPNYCLAEFAGIAGVELVDKHTRRSAFLEGRLAAHLRANIARLTAEDLEDGEVDEFLLTYDALLTNPIRMQ
jgi:hypothetical protein